MLEKGDERATSTRCPKPRRSAGLNAQGGGPDEDAATVLPDGGGDTQKRARTARSAASRTSALQARWSVALGGADVPGLRIRRAG